MSSKFGLDTASDAVILIATEYVRQLIDKQSCWEPLANGGVRITDRKGRRYDYTRDDIVQAAALAVEILKDFEDVEGGCGNS